MNSYLNNQLARALQAEVRMRLATLDDGAAVDRPAALLQTRATQLGRQHAPEHWSIRPARAELQVRRDRSAAAPSAFWRQAA
jgi:hypothetical protein